MAIRRRKMTLRQRMMLCSASVLVFFLLVTLVFNSFFSRMISYQVDGMYDMLTNELEAQIAYNTDSLQNCASSLAYSKNVQGALFSASALNRMEHLILARDSIYNYKQLNQSIQNVLVLSDTDSRVAISDSYTRLELDELERMGISRDRYVYREYFSPILDTDAGSLSFMYVLPFRNALYQSNFPETSMGTICILYRLSGLFSIDLFRQGDVNYVVISDGENCYPLTPSSTAVCDALTALDAGVSELYIGGERCAVFGFTLPTVGWKLYYALPMSDMLSISDTFYRQSFLWTICGLLVITLLFSYQFWYISSSIHMVTHSVASAKGDTHARIDSPELPEMHMLADALNELLGRIDEANRANAQAQQNVYDALLAKNQAEMAFYRQQINPHFLFNTLECIRSMAQHCNAEPVEHLISSASRVLQYSLYSNVIVSVQEELDNARNYFHLMNSRAMGAYTYREFIAQEALAYPMVSMVLQPLYENALLHGARQPLGRQFILHVEISITAENQLYIAIVDNGKGIAPEIVDRLNGQVMDNTAIESTENIGTLNVARRLRLADSQCRVRFRSQKGCYTKVELWFPNTLSLEDDFCRISRTS